MPEKTSDDYRKERIDTQERAAAEAVARRRLVNMMPAAQSVPGNAFINQSSMIEQYLIFKSNIKRQIEVISNTVNQNIKQDDNEINQMTTDFLIFLILKNSPQIFSINDYSRLNPEINELVTKYKQLGGKSKKRKSLKRRKSLKKRKSKRKRRKN